MPSHFRRLLRSLALAGVSALPLCAQTTPPPIAQAPADLRFIDAMVVYTPAARIYAGSTTAMHTAIGSYLTLTNATFANSNISLRLRLVAATEVPYTEDGHSLDADLAWFGSNAGIVAMRNAYGADVMVLVRRGAEAGVSGVTNTPYGGFSVIADDFAAASLGFPHEFGHQFNCDHDRETAGIWSYQYNFGWRFTGNDGVAYRTVMATGAGTRIAHFSNPTVTYQGVATGVARWIPDLPADNAQMIDLHQDDIVLMRGVADTLVPGDFAGDGTPNVVLLGKNFQCRYWDMSGVTRTSSTDLSYVFTGVWTPFGSGDLDGDGKADLLFKSDDGRIAVWFMNGTARTSAAVLPDIFLPAVWTPSGTADLNGDGKSDLLFKDGDGRIAVWYMNGTTRISAAVLADRFTGATRLFAGGDFNNDGNDDLAFSFLDGRVTVWLMNGASRTSSTMLSPRFSAIWTPAGCADFNGDGKADLVFKSSDSRMAVWFMNGASVSSSTVGSPTLDTL